MISATEPSELLDVVPLGPEQLDEALLTHQVKRTHDDQGVDITGVTVE